MLFLRYIWTRLMIDSLLVEVGRPEIENTELVKMDCFTADGLILVPSFSILNSILKDAIHDIDRRARRGMGYSG